MQEPEPQDPRPDIFGPYFNGMIALHTGLLEFIKGYGTVRRETILVPLQCTFGEYTGEHHDDTYEWKKLFFGGNQERCFAVGVNKQRLFSLEDNLSRLLAKVVDTWAEAGFDPPQVEGGLENVRALAKPEWEMVLSVHFYFDGRAGDDPIDDTQYFKIVYTQTSLETHLEAIRRLGLAS